MQFTQYNDAIFDGFCLHSKKNEIINRKHEIINRICQYYNLAANSVLFIGFNPAALTIKANEVYLAEVSQKAFDYLKAQRPSIQLYDQPRKFDLIVAFDEYLTFARTEVQQKQMIDNLCSLSAKLAITTVKDYKNQDFKDREYSQPAIIKHDEDITAFTEIHNWHTTEKNSWETNLYQLRGNQATCCGQYQRRSLFFKQLAKFSIDNGAKNFLVHKNMMYKSIIKKNYEHIISISFC